ncbi:hypothetical protein HN873_005905, partial [Arachis hypogaea]
HCAVAHFSPPTTLFPVPPSSSPPSLQPPPSPPSRNHPLAHIHPLSSLFFSPSPLPPSPIPPFFFPLRPPLLLRRQSSGLASRTMLSL